MSLNTESKIGGAVLTETEAQPLPKWVTDTPNETDYQLVMFGDDGSELQGIWIERDEFIALKEHLAEMRGFVDQDRAREQRLDWAKKRMADSLQAALDNFRATMQNGSPEAESK